MFNKVMFDGLSVNYWTDLKPSRVYMIRVSEYFRFYLAKSYLAGVI